MSIISVITSQTGLVGTLPSVAYINTTSTVAEATTTGFLNKEVANGTQFSLPCIAAVSTKATPTSVPQVGWYEVQHVNGDWSLDAGSNTGIGLTNGHIFVGNASNIATDVAMSGDITISNLGVTAIGAGVIVNADVNASAAIAFSKLATLASTNILVGSAGGVATSVAMTGDVTISNTGVTAIGTGVIVNADINASAAIDFSKLATLASGNILVGSAGGVATSVAMSGDATIIASGALTIAANAITTAKIIDANVTLAKLASGITPAYIVKFAGKDVSGGGSATVTITATGVVAGDLAFAQVQASANAISVQKVTAGTDQVVVLCSGDPGAATMCWQALRAAA